MAISYCENCHSQLDEKGEHYHMSECVQQKLEDGAELIGLSLELHQCCRALLRYTGVDKDRANAAYDSVREATHKITTYHEKYDL